MLLMVFQSLAGVFIFVPGREAHAANSWYSDYTNRVKIPISASSSGAQTDYQMSIILHSKSGTNTAGDIYLNSHLQDTTSFNDIRFTDTSNSLKNFWIEKIEDETGGKKATVWVKLDTPASGTIDYYLYYGKSGDTTASSYDNTFTKDYGESGLVGLWHMDETPGSELLTDGSLETWTNSTTLTNWTNDGASTGVRDIAQETVNKQGGNYALKLAATANDGTNFGVYQNITTVSNQTYQVNLYQYLASRTAGTLKIEAWDNTNNVSLGSQSITAIASAYSYLSFRFISTNTTSVRIRIYLNGETTSGTASIDTISVKPSTSTTADSSGNSNTGTIYGASRTDTDGGQWGSRSDVRFSQGSAFQFDGKDDYVDMGNSASLNVTGAMTVEAWMKTSETKTFQFVAGHGSTNNAGWRIQVNNGNTIAFYLSNGTTINGITRPYIAGNLAHVVAVYSGSTIRLYVDGLYSSSLSSIEAINYMGVSNTWIGQIQGAGGTSDRYFNGIIDDVRIYNRALSQDEISRQYIRSKYASVSPIWSTPGVENQRDLGVVTQSVNVSSIKTTSAVLSGFLTGFGGDASAAVSFKYGLTSDNLNQNAAAHTISDYGFFSQMIAGLSPDTTYYFQAIVANSTNTAYGSVLSFRTAALETNYYRTVINNDGSLTFLNKDTGAIILNSSPRYNLNYGDYTNITKNPSNNSFETDSDGDGIADNWTFDKTYIRLSTERANNGTNSVKFNMTSADADHRRAISSLLPVTKGNNVYISIDSYVSSLTSMVASYNIVYYKTSDGTGTRYTSSDYSFPSTVGSWKNTNFTWTPPNDAKSFRIMIYFRNDSVATAFFDNIVVSEKSYNYITSSGTIDHILTTNDGSSVITATDDTNPYATIKHRYELNANTPYVKYTSTLQYKQNVDVTEERFDFIVPAQTAQIMTRDLKLVNFDSAQAYWSDVYTPKVVKFVNGLSFSGADTMDAMRSQAVGGDIQLSFYSDYKENHPHFYRIPNGGGSVEYASENKRSMNDAYSVSLIFSINPSSAAGSLIKTRQPYGYDSTLIFTNHADAETLAAVKAVSYGTEDQNSPSYRNQGLVSRGLGLTKSVFVSGQIGSLQDTDFKSLTDQMYQDGVEIVGHTITTSTDDRNTIASGLQALSQYNAKNWIDHGSGDGIGQLEDIDFKGAIKNDPYYILDIFDRYNYQYAWSYVDLQTTDHDLNVIRPANTWEIRPFLFYNNQVDDNISDDKKIYLWSTITTSPADESSYTNTNVDNLISERGMHIGHSYLADPSRNNHTFYTNPATGKTEITPAFDSELAYIAQKKEAGLIWSPTVSKMGDYLVPLKDVSVTNNTDGSYTVTNNSASSLTGITLLAENDIKSVSINNKTLTSFGNSFGSKELVLPTLNPQESFTLYLSYGAKDTSIPAITSNDTGKKKVNEITGVYDNTAKTLTMTAEGDKETRSFTVKIPDLAGKRLLVKDVSTDTSIGDYQASSAGEITFSAPLGSLHTFLIAESPSLAFISPSKPSVSNISISTTNGTLSLTNLPSNITQIAVSTLEDFKDASWEYAKDVQSILAKYADAAKLYIKFRTNDGAVSDTITYTPQDSNNPQNTNIPLQDGDIVKTPSSPDIYVIKLQNSKKYKRLILSPQVFNSYHHLKWDNIKTIPEEQLNQYQTSNLVKELSDTIVYTLTPHGDQGQRKPFDLAQTYDPDSIYTINKVDRDSYEWEE